MPPMKAEQLFWDLADELSREDPRVVEGTIMNGRCLRVGAEFLALVDFKGSGLVVKLPAARVARLIAAGHGRPFAPAGRVFEEWVAVPRPDRRRWRALLREGVAHVGDAAPAATRAAGANKAAPGKAAAKKAAPRKPAPGVAPITLTVTLVEAGPMSAIPIEFDPREVFGNARAPVRVTIGDHSYRSTIFTRNGRRWVPLRRSHREAAGLTGGETVTVTLAHDTADRTVTPPADLARALRAAPHAWQRWQELSYSHQREHVEAVEEAKKPETRARRIASAVAMVVARPARKRR